jgi:hypothetical protein
MKHGLILFVLIYAIAMSGLTGCGAASEPSAVSPDETVPYQVVQTVYREAPLSVSELVNGHDFPVNLVKLTGNATSGGRTVIVNGAPVTVTAGNETLLVLSRGKNAIQIKNGDGTIAENFTVSFTPPLAVYVTEYKMDKNYSLPVEARGFVNRPDATVTVNKRPAGVAPDGSFTAQVQLSYAYCNLQAVAVLGDDATEHTIMQSLSGGALTPVYGSHYRFEPHLLAPKNPVTLKPGGTATADLTLMLRTDKGVGAEKCSIIVPGSYPGLTVSITPSEFEGYPNINYHPTVTFSAGPKVTPGEYPFRVEFATASGLAAAANVNVVVEP